MIISMDTKQNPIPFHNKSSQQTRNRMELPQSDKGHLQKKNLE